MQYKLIIPLFSADDLHWIVAEDSLTCSPLVADLLARLGIPFTHIASPQPDVYKESDYFLIILFFYILISTPSAHPIHKLKESWRQTIIF